MKGVAILLGFVVVSLGGCRGEQGAEAAHVPSTPALEGEAPGIVVSQERAQEAPRPPMSAAEIPLAGTETDADWAIVLDRITWARAEGLAQLSIGEAVARIGETFVGDPYTPGTLEVAEPEALVVNLVEFDCVTFVEVSLALARVVHSVSADITDPETLKARYIEELAHLRYRHGVIDGYPSRLHYFSEWIADNEERGAVRTVSHLMGGTEVIQDINFMSTHPDSYRQLADPSNLSLIIDVESRLSAVALYPIRENRVSQFADEVETGDIIAATSTVAGLDIAHTGLAVWKNGQLLLMHAPLVGSRVQISTRPLAERLLGIRGQDGILIARPQPVR